MNQKNQFVGRSISVVNDLSADEQFYLYQKSAQLKDILLNGGDLSPFKIDDPLFGVYLLFFEDSTRTKESFRNAALLHNVKVNDFSADTSSFKKNESLVDTFKILTGYSARSLFIVRSKQEGLCKAMQQQLAEYSEHIGYQIPAFINGGDGRHEHPTQEFLDEFSFLEQLNWQREKIHIALIGDLYHGRTIHSKIDGLSIFNDVEVDLIAPEELKLPSLYIDRMDKKGYQINHFDSIDHYIANGKVAPIWYFTRLQLERMGDEILEKAEKLRYAVSFRQEQINKLPDGCRFFHPLPRHKEVPVIPTFLDKTPLNSWDNQAINGYFTRTIAIAMLAGKLGDDFDGEGLPQDEVESAFVEEVSLVDRKRTPPSNDYKVGIKPVENGIVIDHIGKGKNLEEIWGVIDRIRRILNLNIRSSHGVYRSNKLDNFKGIISLPDVHSFNEPQLKKLSAIAPECTLNIVAKSQVEQKYRLHMPPKIYNFDQISCKNEWCISNPKQHEQITNDFNRSGDTNFVCSYCEREHSHSEIWD